MDESRFDTLAREWGRGTRRSVLQLVAGTGLGALFLERVGREDLGVTDEPKHGPRGVVEATGAATSSAGSWGRRGLDHGAHVVVVGEGQTLVGAEARDRLHVRAELRPLVRAQLGDRGAQ